MTAIPTPGLAKSIASTSRSRVSDGAAWSRNLGARWCETRRSSVVRSTVPPGPQCDLSPGQFRPSPYAGPRPHGRRHLRRTTTRRRWLCRRLRRQRSRRSRSCRSRTAVAIRRRIISPRGWRRISSLSYRGSGHSRSRRSARPLPTRELRTVPNRSRAHFWPTRTCLSRGRSKPWSASPWTPQRCSRAGQEGDPPQPSRSAAVVRRDAHGLRAVAAGQVRGSAERRAKGARGDPTIRRWPWHLPGPSSPPVGRPRRKR